MNHDEICFAVMDCLEKQGIKSTYEYPGFIRCETKSGKVFAFGGNNEWCGQIWANADEESEGEQGRLVESVDYIGVEQFFASDPASIADNFVAHTLRIIEEFAPTGDYSDDQITISH